jgi:hypothetical protein
VWAAHFEGWVDRLLSASEIAAARAAAETSDPEATYRVLLELVRERALSVERDAGLPEGAVPGVAVGDVSGDALRAARLYAEGRQSEALALLGTRALERDVAAVHLRAQLRDEIERDVPIWQRQEIVHEYRLAISLGGDPATVARARIRIAQLELELGFVPEAMSALGAHLNGSLPAPYGGIAAITFAEAAFRASEYRAALGAVEAAPRDGLSEASVLWLERAAGDARFRLEEYAPAAQAYAAYSARASRDALLADPITQIRSAVALLRSNQLDAAIALLAPIVQQNIPHPLATLVGLVLVESHARKGEPERMREVAEQILARDPEARDAPLAALFVIEAQRLLGLGVVAPPGIAEMAQFDSPEPAVGLLAYRIETAKPVLPPIDPFQPPTANQELLDRLARIARALPDGSVKALVHDELAQRLLMQLRETRPDRTLDTALLDRIQAELDPRQIDENELLLAIDAFRAAGRFETCSEWALALREREVRPLRRGLGAWRKTQCDYPIGGPRPERAPTPEGETPVLRSDELLEISDNGQAGPYSLAFAALAAEEFVRRGDHEAAVRVYERGLEAFAEPLLIGPVLLRLGELHAAAGRDGIARQRLVRGLTLTEGDATAADPFRKLGTVLLARLVSKRGDPTRLREFIVRDVQRLEPWWPSAYSFLGSRVGLELPQSEGTDPFAIARQEIESTESIRARLKAVTKRKPTSDAAAETPAP